MAGGWAAGFQSKNENETEIETETETEIEIEIESETQVPEDLSAEESNPPSRKSVTPVLPTGYMVSAQI